MKKRLRDRWAAALRSGKFKQGRSILRQRPMNGADEFCCLGVLCHLTPKARQSGVVYGRVQYQSVQGGLSTTWSVPMRVMNDIGLTMDHHATLIDMNDKHKCSFGEIADWIEDNIPTEDDR